MSRVRMEYKRAEILRIMRKNGYILSRTTGDHQVFTKEGCNPIAIPTMHANCMMMARLVKENNLITDFKAAKKEQKKKGKYNG